MSEKNFIVETSAHHIHVTDATLEALFGAGAKLTVKKMLSQPNMFASEERLDVVYHATIKNKVTGEMEKKDFTLKNLSILGPTRKADQIEISLTEARSLKADVPIRESGDTKGSCPCTLVNPKNGNRVDCPEGMIVAKRHIHMTPKDAADFGVKNGDIVAVKIKSQNGRSAVLGDTVIRVSDTYALAMHIDTDESNAIGGLSKGVFGTIVKEVF
ncbi:MAG: PduL/EutD family phosphate acyltransferase [Bacilli bacterium]